MERTYFKNLEHSEGVTPSKLSSVIDQLAFNEQDLIPVITQDATTKDVLMLAWMNKAALNHTLSTNKVTYWSRSRQELWVKGETSGHTQKLVSLSFDCDGDAILCQVNQSGAACHTGRAHCFYLEVDAEKQQVTVQAMPA